VTYLSGFQGLGVPGAGDSEQSGLVLFWFHMVETCGRTAFHVTASIMNNEYTQQTNKQSKNNNTMLE
jgi:hypothetical protein